MVNSINDNKFIFSKDTGKMCVVYSKNNNIEIFIVNNANEIINKFFSSLLSRYQISSEESMKDGYFVFNDVDLLYYKWHKKV